MNASAEKWTAIGAIAGAAAVLLKKIFNRKPKPEYIRRAEFHQQLDAMRDRIGAGYLAVTDRIDANHRQVLSALDENAARFESRIDNLESTVARLDERTTVR